MYTRALAEDITKTTCRRYLALYTGYELCTQTCSSTPLHKQSAYVREKWSRVIRATRAGGLMALPGGGSARVSLLNSVVRCSPTACTGASFTRSSSKATKTTPCDRKSPRLVLGVFESIIFHCSRALPARSSLPSMLAARRFTCRRMLVRESH